MGKVHHEGEALHINSEQIKKLSGGNMTGESIRTGRMAFINCIKNCYMYCLSKVNDTDTEISQALDINYNDCFEITDIRMFCNILATCLKEQLTPEDLDLRQEKLKIIDTSDVAVCFALGNIQYKSKVIELPNQNDVDNFQELSYQEEVKQSIFTKDIRFKSLMEYRIVFFVYQRAQDNIIAVKDAPKIIKMPRLSCLRSVNTKIVYDNKYELDYEIYQTVCSNDPHNEKIKKINLLINRGASVDYQNEDGCTALHHACAMNDREMVKFLLKSGANKDLMNYYGWLPIENLEDRDARNALDTLMNE